MDGLQKIVDRDIRDAQVEALSADRRFAVAYNAALNLASYVIRKNGYRVAAKVGHHRVTFLVAGDILGRQSRKHLDYFDVCRRKRNRLDYDATGVATETEVSELIQKVVEFKSQLGIE